MTEPMRLPLNATGNALGWSPDPLSDVVMSTRVRLARNVVGNPFPHAATESDLARVAKHVLGAAHRLPSRCMRSMTTLNLSQLTDQDKSALVDSHLTSVAHALAGKHRHVILDEKRQISLLINEEDHIRIQVILPGLQANEAWRKADEIDNALQRELPIMYDPELGFLTASVANCGMGLRVSVMVHVPALAAVDRLQATWSAANSLDAAVRGLYGEGTDIGGSIYQVSNVVSMGSTEPQTVGKITAVASYLQAEEAGARELLLRTRYDEMRSLVETAQEALRDAERLSVKEGVRMLSVLRLGHLLGFGTCVTDRVFSDLIGGLRGGTSLIVSPDDRARDIFYHETRRPALFRNSIRAERTQLEAV